ncbi:single-stranded DNA-binding protein [Anaerospora sp.]|uniref:single-stranded DNA-binding protein n=1 Tax=Anaerospora sp. TaxID=1960278 RepID=UPI00289FFC79|nr:single-stranded DNA-binding protein [Anaerospora sp.]
MNSVKLIGRLAQETEVRYTKSGKAVASFTLAVGRGNGTDRQGEATDFIPVVCWQGLAEEAGNTLSKGSQVFVQGRLQIRSYEAADGQKRRVSEVVASFIGRSISDGRKAIPSPGGADFGAFGENVEEQIPF